jgi:hypothetical protein
MPQRRWSSLVGRMTFLSQPRVPANRVERINHALRRRLDDAVANVFHEACLNGDLHTARELLSVMNAMHKRRQQRYGLDRRLSDETLQIAQEALAERERATPAAATPAAATP